MGIAPRIKIVPRSAAGSVIGFGIENLTGTKNGVNKTFTVSHTPQFLTFQGQILYENNGYTLSGLTIVLDLAPVSSEILKSHY